MNYFTRLQGWGKWIVFCLVFGLLPLWLIGWGIERNWDRKFKNNARELSEKMVRRLENIRKVAEDERFFYKMLKNFGKFFDKKYSPPNLNQFRRGLNFINQKYPGLFEFYFSDLNGNVFEELSSKIPSKVIMKKVHEIFSAARAKDRPVISRGLTKSIEAFIGETMSVGNLSEDEDRNTEKVHVVGMGLRHNYFFFQPFSNLTMMAHVNLGAVPRHFSLIKLLEQANKQSSLGKYGFHLSGELPKRALEHVNEDMFLRKCLVDYENSTKDVFISEKYIVAILMGDGKERLWDFLRIPDKVNSSRYHNLERMILLGIFLLLCFISYRYIVPDQSPWLSIRQKLLILLGFVAGLPLVILLVVGQDYLWEKERSLLEETFNSMENTLRAIDNKFTLSLRNIAEAINKLVHLGQSPDGRFLKGVFDEHYAALLKKIPLPTPMIIRRDGEIIQTKEKEKIMQQLGVKMLEKYNFSHGIADANMKKDKFHIEDLFEGDAALSGLYSNMLKRLGNIEKMKFFGKMDRFILINIIGGADGGANFMFFFFWSPLSLSSYYVSNWGKLNEKVTHEPRFFALYPNDPTRSYPSKCEKTVWLQEFSKRIQIRGKLTKEQIKIKGKDFLATGIPGKELDKFILVKIVPAASVSSSIARLRRNLVTLGIFCLCFSLIVGTTIARQFLIPIQHLTDGVMAIDKGHFKHRVPPLENDELGKLSQTFNLVMVGLEELSVGRTIQASLFPVPYLRVGFWKVYGQSVSATELGGDYLDYFALPDGRILVVVGDVTGHGVPAALLMAMAKATVINEVPGDPRPSVVLYKLNELIFHTMRKKRFMTFFYLLTNSETGEITFSNAGHCQPVLVRVDGTFQEIGECGFPLGIKKGKKFTEEKAELKKGDRLYFFTDGIPETTNSAKVVLGYPAFINLMVSFRNLSAMDTCKKIFESVDSYRGNYSQEDDNTLIILEYVGEMEKTSVPACAT
ncbi:MAG: SpoIIE family protein phosphatase [Candidatus Riflebacteria bacterium]|nr:SpoIIE family protein phosphatase [Candidatus Riflebacteria bacterium]